jgi:hypothetical protein
MEQVHVVLPRAERERAAVRKAAGPAAAPLLPSRPLGYDGAAQLAARRQLAQRAAQMRAPAAGVLQPTWKRGMRPAPGGVPEDGDWYPYQGTYRNVETGESYDPRTRILDNPDEAFGLQELDERQHEILMQEIFGGTAVPVFVNDRDGRVYDPATRREFAGMLGPRVLDDEAHARRMEQIQADLDYAEYLESLSEEGEVDGGEEPLGVLEEDDAFREHVDVEAELDRLDLEEQLALLDEDHDDEEEETSYTVLSRGQYVDQDDRGEDDDDDQDDRVFHYIGTELAYTFYLSVCTALAMYHPGTGLSFLAHNDSNNEDRLADAVAEYFAEVRQEAGEDDVLSQIQTELYLGYAARKGSGVTSEQTVLSALRSAVEDTPGGAELLQNVSVFLTRDKGAMVTVGDGLPPRVAAPIIGSSSELDMAVNLVFLRRHHTDNGMSVLNMIRREDAADLVNDLDEVQSAVQKLLEMPQDFQDEMEPEIVALYTLQGEIEDQAERRR